MDFRRTLPEIRCQPCLSPVHAQNGDCHQFPPLELVGCTRFACLSPDPLSPALPKKCEPDNTVRKLFFWKLKQREIRLGERTVIMGVLNVTPDSFSDGGKYSDPDRAYARAIELEEQGADIIDIGAESTRPGSARISAAEEIRRLIPVLKRLKDKLTI